MKLQISLSSPTPRPEDWKEFESVLNKAAALDMNETQISQFMKSFEKKLDAPLVSVIDSVLAGGDYRKSRVQDALDRGEQSQGTEPRAALTGASAFMRLAIKKV